MWLLHTTTGELRHFHSPHDVKGGYAILSHVWQEHEMSFQELNALRSPSATTSTPNSNDTGPLSLASTKIRECCTLAMSHGYGWLWIDTCCIDMSSSAELSEAINSMFAWYSHALVCYAYLHDVPTGRGSLEMHGSAFRRSKWFTRGWTLQELIAPRSVMFLSQDWEMLGTKASLAALLEQITGVDADVLTFHRNVTDVSVARRMWWASGRRTTRIEDEAYSLMGLFNVHMPTIYGEGPRAFRRLQEEILKSTSDQTLFAWGNVLPPRATPFREHLSYSNYHADSHLFAPSPAAFRSSENMVALPVPVAIKHAIKTLAIPPAQLEETAQRSKRPTTASSSSSSSSSYSISLPDINLTTHGARSKMLVLESSLGPSVLAVAVLACLDKSTGSCIGLLLRRRRQGETKLASPRYHVGVTVRGAQPWARLRYRLAQIAWAPHHLSFGDRAISARWRTIYVSHRASSRQPPARHKAPVVPAAFRFCFPRWVQVELRKLGFESDSDVPLPTERMSAGRLVDGGELARYAFVHRTMGERILVQLGQCHGSPWATATIQPAPQPAALVPSSVDTTDGNSAVVDEERRIPTATKPVFECHRDRISSWLNGTKTFGDSSRSVQLTFTRANGGGAHLLDVRLGGRTYASLRAAGSASIHTLARSVVRLSRWR